MSHNDTFATNIEIQGVESLMNCFFTTSLDENFHLRNFIFIILLFEINKRFFLSEKTPK